MILIIIGFIAVLVISFVVSCSLTLGGNSDSYLPTVVVFAFFAALDVWLLIGTLKQFGIMQ